MGGVLFFLGNIPSTVGVFRPGIIITSTAVFRRGWVIPVTEKPIDIGSGMRILGEQSLPGIVAGGVDVVTSMMLGQRASKRKISYKKKNKVSLQFRELPLWEQVWAIEPSPINKIRSFLRNGMVGR